MKNGLAALRFLTVAGWFGSDEPDPERVGRGVGYFPIIGLVLGTALVLVEYTLDPYVASEILSIVAIAMLTLLTGARHFADLEETLARPSLDLRRWKQERVVITTVVVFFVLLTKIRALEVTGDGRLVALLLSPVFARWAAVVLLYGAAPFAEPATRRLAEKIGPWQLLVATLFTMFLGAVLVGRLTLWLGLFVSLLALVARSWLIKRSRPLRHEHSGALIEIAEVLSFVFFATL